MLIRPKILVVLLVALTVTSRAEVVTSTLDGGVVIKLPKIGQIVKKGEVLVVFFRDILDTKIVCKKAELKSAKELIKAKKFDVERATKLVDRGMSQNELEECIYDLESAKCLEEQREAELKGLEAEAQFYSINAPFNCKVTKVYMIENGGSYAGQRLLSVERVN